MDIKSIIKEKGYTLEKVAMLLQPPVTRGALSQSINGNPTYSRMKEIADVIGCKVGDFFLDEMSETEGGNFSNCPYCGNKIQIGITVKRVE